MPRRKKPRVTVKKVNRVNRSPLTKKAVAAIKLYVNLNYVNLNRPDGFYFLREAGIEHTLKADRMSRDKLYSYLQRRGYKWRNGHWNRK